eukprot:10967310-Alexandrium_andersonii.AAC.1
MCIRDSSKAERSSDLGASRPWPPFPPAEPTGSCGQCGFNYSAEFRGASLISGCAGSAIPADAM